jgi:hypothetical protein
VEISSQYDLELVRHLTCNPIAENMLQRVADAMNGLTCEFGKSWVEACLFGFEPETLSREMGISVDTLASNSVDFDDLVFLWDDLEVLRGYHGFESLQKKLRKGRRDNNVDLEISVASDLCRLAAEVRLEPKLPNGRKPDVKFKVTPQSEWVYAEITRKNGGKAQMLIKTRGEELASLVAARDPTRRNFIAITLQMDPSFSDAEFDELIAWVPNSAPNSVFKNYAIVGSVLHNTDETPLVLPHFVGPVSVVTKGNLKTGAFGAAYLHVPDLGAKQKVFEKSRQAMEGHESLLFIDLSATHASQAEWDDQVGTMGEAAAFSAVILLRSERGVRGLTRVCTIVEPNASRIILSEATKSLLKRFANLRVEQNLS